MAHITKRPGKNRKLPWRVQIRRKGLPVVVKHFATEDEGKFFAAEWERRHRLVGLPLTNAELKKHTLGDIVRRYLKEITPTKRSHINEAASLNKFLRNSVCAKSLAYISRQDVYEYISERRKNTWNGKTISPPTVRREISTIQHIFEVAKERWGLTNLENPFRGIKIKGSVRRRKRRLEDGEEKRLLDACQRCLGLNRFYVPLAIHLAIETGMRQQEIFNLRWKDVDFGKRRIEIHISKTDHVSEFAGRAIVLTYGALVQLLSLQTSLKREGHFKKDARIFPMTKSAFKQSWADTVKRAGIEGLTFHDLRREAGSRFEEAGLTKLEHDVMLGHKNNDMHSLYVATPLKSIQEKLDKHAERLSLEMPPAKFRAELTDAGVSHKTIRALEECRITANSRLGRKILRAG